MYCLTSEKKNVARKKNDGNYSTLYTYLPSL